MALTNMQQEQTSVRNAFVDFITKKHGKPSEEAKGCHAVYFKAGEVCPSGSLFVGEFPKFLRKPAHKQGFMDFLPYLGRRKSAAPTAGWYVRPGESQTYYYIGVTAIEAVNFLRDQMGRI